MIQKHERTRTLTAVVAATLSAPLLAGCSILAPAADAPATDAPGTGTAGATSSSPTRSPTPSASRTSAAPSVVPPASSAPATTTTAPIPPASATTSATAPQPTPTTEPAPTSGTTAPQLDPDDISHPPGVPGPQPLGPAGSQEELLEARDRLLESGYSPEEAAAWPTLPVVVPEEAIAVVADALGRGANLTYTATFDADRRNYEVRVTAPPAPGYEDVPGTTAVYVVESDGSFDMVSQAPTG